MKKLGFFFFRLLIIWVEFDGGINDKRFNFFLVIVLIMLSFYFLIFDDIRVNFLVFCIFLVIFLKFRLN